MTINRAGAICLYEILREYSDSDHILRMPDIIAKMKTIYGITADRRSIYSAVDLLRELGIGISDYNQNGIGYFLDSPEFDPAEVRVLIESVFANRAIPAKQSERLVKKLGRLSNVHHRRSYRHLTCAKPEKRSDNKELFLNIEVIDEAISEGKKVSFTYLAYDFDKKLKPRREKKYTASPCRMVVTNDHYYLLCKMRPEWSLSLYRLDLMQDCEITDEAIDATFDKAEIESAIEDSIYAWLGKAEPITLRCKNNILGDVIDRFGRGIVIERENEETFLARIRVSPTGMRFWAMQYLSHVEVLSPASLREEIIEALRNNPYLALEGN